MDGGLTWNTALPITELSTYTMYDEELGFASSAYYKNVDANPVLYATDDNWNTFEDTAACSIK